MLDTKPYTDEINRSWLFRSVGYGHDYGYWKDIVSELRLVGYDGVLSIEHEDSLMSSNEGLEKASSSSKTSSSSSSPAPPIGRRYRHARQPQSRSKTAPAHQPTPRTVRKLQPAR